HMAHLSRAQRVGDVLRRILIPLDDIDLLAIQLVDDVLDADTAHADARPDGVDAFLARGDGDLGSETGLTRDGLDLDRSAEDLRDLLLEQAAQHQPMRT